MSISNEALVIGPTLSLHPGRGTGLGKLRGTTKTVGDPDMPVGRTVFVELEIYSAGELRRTRYVHRVESDPDTGEWMCPYLDESATFTAIAYDHTGEYDPAAKAGLTPELMRAEDY